MAEPPRGATGGSENASAGPARKLHAVEAQNELREGLRAGQLVLHYQPIVRLDTVSLRGVESLVRWQHPVGGLLPPDDFLPGVPYEPVMREITSHVLNRACRDARRWPDWTVSVNVAAGDVVDPAFADQVLAALRQSRIEPQRLTLELTEQSVVQDIARATANLHVLRSFGVGVALDDFGTGYSSLLYLRQLPITQIKIVKVFVSTVENGGDDAAIVESIIRLSARIGLDVVAEGVET